MERQKLITEASRFVGLPFAREAAERYQAAMNTVDFLSQNGLIDRDNWRVFQYRQHLEQTRDTLRVASYAWWAVDGYYSAASLRSALDELKAHIGEEAYAAGRLPSLYPQDNLR